MNVCIRRFPQPGSFTVATMKITLFEPTQVGIGYEYGGYQVPAPAIDFIYMAQ